ncbi:gastrula zinc finger protein XlCGF7.1-like [Dermacentor albipictus]|uniref:gastrula zinc finger protein XlCGF7.1-like n=1 Tax=Dermacentor albipictus TaxID=60249 RepID=UPI0031FC4E56
MSYEQVPCPCNQLESQDRQWTPSSPCNIEDCDYSSPRKFNMERHRYNLHACLKHPPPGMPARGEKVCCGESFLTLHRYTRHRELKHGDGHLCRLCGRLFPRQSHLERHMLVHTREKTYGCGLCGYATPSPSNLERHVGTAKCRRDARRIAAGLAERPQPEGLVAIIPDVATMLAVRGLLELGRGVRIFGRGRCARQRAQGVKKRKV